MKNCISAGYRRLIRGYKAGAGEEQGCDNEDRDRRQKEL